jgi:cell division protein FtsX
MNHANQLYGKNIGSAPSRIIIRTKDPGHPELISYLKQKQLTTDQDKTRFSKYRQIVEMVVNITGVTGLLMFLFAMLIFTLFIQLTISSCKEEIKLLLTLGASPSQLRSFLIRQFFPSNIWIVLCSLLIISLVQYGFALFLQQQSAFISYFISPITMGISFFILLIIYILNRRNINTSIRNY